MCVMTSFQENSGVGFCFQSPVGGAKVCLASVGHRRPVAVTLKDTFQQIPGPSLVLQFTCQSLCSMKNKQIIWVSFPQRLSWTLAQIEMCPIQSPERESSDVKDRQQKIPSNSLLELWSGSPMDSCLLHTLSLT